MSEHEKKLEGLDFAQGVALANIAEGGMILGHVAGDAVLLARRGQELFAIGAECTHYHGPLAEGILVEDTIRCPWHHACFSLRTGEALRNNRSPVYGRELMDLNGAVVLVTGDNGGPGQRICHALAKEGMHIAVMYAQSRSTSGAAFRTLVQSGSTKPSDF
jgi:nitrite reductase/ring-hydroxylating ferredoxin subunit